MFLVSRISIVFSPVIAFLLIGSVSALGGDVVNLATTSPQILIRGGAPGDMAASSLASGDINRDFIPDMLIGSPLADELNRVDSGKAYVFRGSSNFPPNHALTLATSNVALTVSGAATSDHLGTAVAAGDVNGDSVDDFIVSAADAENGALINAGKVYVLYGSVSLGSQTHIDLATGSPGITIAGRSSNDRLGVTLASADVNGDSFDDIIMGAPESGGNGKVFIIYGSNTFGPTKSFDLSSVNPDVLIIGRSPGDALGSAITAGDVNGDNIADIIIGAPLAEPTGGIADNRGEVYILYGSASLPSSIDLSTVNPDVELVGGSSGDQLGAALALSNINGSGSTDLLVGAPRKSLTWRENAGAVYVFYGDGFSQGETRIVSNSTADYTVYGDTPLDSFGSTLAGGDINGDGIGDLVIGAKDGDFYFIENRGKTYVIYGGSSLGSHAIYDLDQNEAPLLILGVKSTDFMGTTVAAGDYDNDGRDEVMTGTPFADPENLLDKGAAYVVGTNFNTALDAEIVSHSIPAYWYPGQKRYCSVSVKNKGLTTWNNITQIKLGAANGTDPFSVIVRYDPDHVPVRHGDVAAFVLELTAPAQSAVYKSEWQMVDLSNTFFGGKLSLNLTVVKKGMDSVPMGSTIPVAINADSVLHPVKISYMNVGTCEWKADSLFELKTTLASEPFAVSKTSSAPAAATATVRLGEVYPFPFDFLAPSGTGWQGSAWQTHRPTLRWFGTTFVDHMAWNNIPRWATLQNSNVPKKVTAGQGFGLTLTISNDGSITWNNTNKIRLGVPSNSVAPFTGDIRWALDTGESITTGQNKTFTVLLTAPQTPGIYPLTFRMLHPAVTWFGETFPISIEVTTGPIRDAVVTASRVPEVVVAGSTFNMTLEFTNWGRKTWIEDRGYRLTAVGSTSPFIAPSTVLMNAGEGIIPGDKRTFSFNVTAPGSPGNYTLAYRMTQAGSRDFGQIAKVPIKVVTTGLDAKVISHTIPNYIGANETINVEVVMRNEGTVDWTRTGQKNLGFRGTATPFTIANRQPLRVGEVVKPGQTTCFYFPIKAPIPLQTKNLTFQMVHDGGIGWFGEQIVKDITVLGKLYDATLVSLSAPSQVTVNENFNVVMTLKNRGSRFWNRADEYYLSVVGVNLSPFIGSVRTPIAPYTEVEYNQNYTFTVPLKAPATPGGPHTLTFQMVDVGVRWFGVEVPVTITVVAGSKPGVQKAAQNSAATSYYVLDSAGAFHPLNGGSLTGVDLSNLGAASVASGTDSVVVLDPLGGLHDAVQGFLGNKLLGMPVARDVEFLNGAPAILDVFGALHGAGVPSGQFFGWDIARDLATSANGTAYILDGLGGVHPVEDAPPVEAAFLGIDAAVALVFRADGQGGYVLDAFGNVYPFGNAPDLGSAPQAAPVAVDLKLTDSEGGYYILDVYGNVTVFGDAATLAPVNLPEGLKAVKLLAVKQ